MTTTSNPSDYPTVDQQAQSFNTAVSQLGKDTQSAANYEAEMKAKLGALFATVPYAVLYELIPLMLSMGAPIDSNKAAIQDDVITVDNQIQTTAGIANGQFNQVMEDAQQVQQDLLNGKPTTTDNTQLLADSQSFVETLDLLGYEVNGGGPKAGSTAYLSQDTINQLNTLLSQINNAFGISPNMTPSDAASQVADTVMGWENAMTPTGPSGGSTSGSAGQIPTGLTAVNQALTGLAAIFTNLAPATNALVTADNSAAAKLYRLGGTLEAMLVAQQKQAINNQKPQ